MLGTTRAYFKVCFFLLQPLGGANAQSHSLWNSEVKPEVSKNALLLFLCMLPHKVAYTALLGGFCVMGAFVMEW